METILQLDQDLFLYLNGLGTDTWDGFWMFVTSKFSSIPLYALLLFLLYRKWGLKNTLFAVVVVALMVVITDQVTKFFKFQLELRLRPCYELEDKVRLVKDWCGSPGGYFSGHAANMMALSVLIGTLLKPYYKLALPLLVIWGLMVGYSRIYIGVHYPGDVLTGFVFGIMVALGCHRLFKYLVQKFGEAV